MNSILKMRVGETLPVFDATITDVNDDPIDLSGATVTLEVEAYNSEGDALVLACNVVGPGHVQYIWPAPFDDPVNYRGRLRLVFTDGTRFAPTEGFVTILVQP